MINIDRRTLLKMTGGALLVLRSSFACALLDSSADSISINWNFEGGSLAKADRIDDSNFRCHVNGQVDQDGRNRQASWYYFRVDGAKGRLLTFTMVDLSGEYNYRPNAGAITGDTLPFYSFDGINWLPIEEASYDRSGPTLSYKIDISSDRVWVAHTPPYTLANFKSLSNDFAHNPNVTIETIGRSVEGREIPLVTITDRSVADKNKKVVWLMFRQHAWESGSSWTGEGLMRFVSSADPVAQQIRKGAIVKVLPLCDPDGVFHGTVRFNGYGFDLNRNWDVIDPVKMPEITAERKVILDWVDAGKRIDFFLTLHNDEYNEYLQGPPDERQSALLKKVWNNWSSGATFAPTEQPSLDATTTTEGKPGRMNVVQGLSHDRGLPAFEAETRITKHPKLGRRPNVQDRMLAGRELIQAIWKSI
jgi:Zinc carboxypeptidase/Cytosolic carboxypeptidase N-terminal domain